MNEEVNEKTVTKPYRTGENNRGVPSRAHHFFSFGCFLESHGNPQQGET
jgi:hypothetical protein